VSRAFSGGKRNREASRALKKTQKEERLRRNRELRARGIDPDLSDAAPVALPEIKLEDVVISVARQPRNNDNGPTKLFVGGIASTTTSGDLRVFFSRFGELVEATVVVNRSTGQSRGFGFVTFRSSTDANQAIAGTDGAELDGHPIRVNHAEARPGRY
jgi:RNA recognition motif-containing protein